MQWWVFPIRRGSPACLALRQSRRSSIILPAARAGPDEIIGLLSASPEPRSGEPPAEALLSRANSVYLVVLSSIIFHAQRRTKHHERVNYRAL
jgi:hypothetical protein